ncbi:MULTISPECIES: phosphatidylglycerophosphatase B [unclassified Klebsiella]|uniref:phosphatidylglycerophosphatase B n=1 Tax=Enterobacteriaceae TaxID=543 RepID=UPI0015DC6263|nr:MULTISPECIES: phosphatidylglycerophosphatase B [unclassified Klebsiella]HAT3954949.1 phosphatidylglycerophosphatase B [Kluyvera ascorbata]BBR58605.1 phosphatidylglycerophosphatase B [Klebsiella sp. WP4-W18-ESBL-05]BBS92095.1 phosphatidylglycerophosphatase B [Klebsiella sp. WP7-S18-CRE-02]BBS97117.1 phosphatidylglycerophosphatase B [Klebsiella sp. WP7-S18-CRE-03]BBT02151.1 phosphatidylglycerophosphatase B [Klebsiella sp. WP7-S18-ESBL-04]
MPTTATRTLIGAAILLLMPLAVWITGWQWLPGPSGWGLKALYAVTETVTQPWGIITHLLLCGLFVWALRPRPRGAIVLVLILSAAVVLGQGAKSLVKGMVQEPRPFVVWLEKTQQIPVEQFYTLKRSERSALVKEQLAQQRDIPGFLRHHWQKETGFAFPSGHTMFAATWALLAAGLLWARRRAIAVALMMAWAIAVMGSRLLLGMHWPLDLMVATVMSWVLATLAGWLAVRYCGLLEKET